MNLNTKAGDEIIYAYPGNGRDGDKKLCEVLTVGAIYAVDKLEVGSYSSQVWLEGYGGPFNTVMFENRIERT